MLIPTYYLLSKICDIFATRRRILLKINKNYFRGGEVRFIRYNHSACSTLLHAVFLYVI